MNIKQVLNDLRKKHRMNYILEKNKVTNCNFYRFSNGQKGGYLLDEKANNILNDIEEVLINDLEMIKEYKKKATD